MVHLLRLCDYKRGQLRIDLIFFLLMNTSQKKTKKERDIGMDLYFLKENVIFLGLNLVLKSLMKQPYFYMPPEYSLDPRIFRLYFV